MDTSIGADMARCGYCMLLAAPVVSPAEGVHSAQSLTLQGGTA